MQIFGVPIDNISKKHVLHFLHDCMHEERFHRLATVNPEFLLLAQKDLRFRENLLKADLRVADGAGVSWALGLQGEVLSERLPGALLLRSVLTLAAAHRHSVFLAIRKDGLSSLAEIKSAIVKKFGDIPLDGFEFDADDFDFVSRIPGIESQILLCNFGAPEQEFFLEAAREKSPSVRLAMGVGGAFDFLTGKVKRAPGWMQKVGLEWLWRLKEQPRRLPRILRAVFLFPWRVFTEKSS